MVSDRGKGAHHAFPARIRVSTVQAFSARRAAAHTEGCIRAPPECVPAAQVPQPAERVRVEIGESEPRRGRMRRILLSEGSAWLGQELQLWNPHVRISEPD